MVDYKQAFDDFDVAGGRRALERQLEELDRAAQTSIAGGSEPDPRIMALREALQRLLAALDDLGRTATPPPSETSRDG